MHVQQQWWAALYADWFDAFQCSCWATDASLFLFTCTHVLSWCIGFPRMCDLTHGWQCVLRFSGVCHSHSLKMAANRLYDSSASGSIKRTAATCTFVLHALRKSRHLDHSFLCSGRYSYMFIIFEGKKWDWSIPLGFSSLAFAPVCEVESTMEQGPHKNGTGKKMSA